MFTFFACAATIEYAARRAPSCTVDSVNDERRAGPSWAASERPSASVSFADLSRATPLKSSSGTRPHWYSRSSSAVRCGSGLWLTRSLVML